MLISIQPLPLLSLSFEAFPTYFKSFTCMYVHTHTNPQSHIQYTALLLRLDFTYDLLVTVNSEPLHLFSLWSTGRMQTFVPTWAENTKGCLSKLEACIGWETRLASLYYSHNILISFSSSLFSNPVTNFLISKFSNI